MAVTNAFEITYGTTAVGGVSQSLLLDGPYVFANSHDTLRVVFQAIVVASSFDDLQTKSAAVESAFRQRDLDITITLGDSSWVYTRGENVIKTTAECVKSGSPSIDRGFARAYTVTITGELPSDDTDGLRELDVHVDYGPGRKKVVSMRGLYTALDGQTATEQYQAEFDDRAEAALTSIDGSATWELVDEQYTQDRLDELLAFSRQYTQVLFNQMRGTLDDAEVRDHHIQFTDMATHPGDSSPGVARMRRVACTYDAHLDIEVTTDVEAVKQRAIEHLTAEFVNQFTPRVYGVEDARITFDQTEKRIALSMQVIYAPGGGSDLLEISLSTGYRENNVIDYTFVHNGDPLAAHADQGFKVRERVTERRRSILGGAPPANQLGSPTSGPQGLTFRATSSSSLGSGWNPVTGSAQATTNWIGDPLVAGGQQVQVTTITETVVERFHKSPSGGGGTNEGGFPIFTIGGEIAPT